MMGFRKIKGIWFLLAFGVAAVSHGMNFDAEMDDVIFNAVTTCFCDPDLGNCIPYVDSRCDPINPVYLSCVDEDGHAYNTCCPSGYTCGNSEQHCMPPPGP